MFGSVESRRLNRNEIDKVFSGETDIEHNVVGLEVCVNDAAAVHKSKTSQSVQKNAFCERQWNCFVFRQCVAEERFNVAPHDVRNEAKMLPVAIIPDVRKMGNKFNTVFKFRTRG